MGPAERGPFFCERKRVCRRNSTTTLPSCASPANASAAATPRRRPPTACRVGLPRVAPGHRAHGSRNRASRQKVTPERFRGIDGYGRDGGALVNRIYADAAAVMPAVRILGIGPCQRKKLLRGFGTGTEKTRTPASRRMPWIEGAARSRRPGPGVRQCMAPSMIW